jgi:acyl-homoserine lactone acylase PvdQ
MTRASRIFRYLVAGLFVVVGAALVLGWWAVRRPLAKLDGSVAIAGLKDGVIVDRDGWGRPWIRAKSLQDVVTAQGYVMAQERLWQMDLLRRAAGGDLSEIFGAVGLAYDRENRTLGMRQAAERAAADASPEIRGLLEAYARGVNDNIAERGGKLPIEFVALGYRPRAWTPADTYLISLYMYKTLTSTWKAKLNRQWIVSKVGEERAKEMFVSDSPLDHFIWTAGTSLPPPVTSAGSKSSMRLGDRARDGEGDRHGDADAKPPFAGRSGPRRRIFWRSSRKNRRRLLAAIILRLAARIRLRASRCWRTTRICSFRSRRCGTSCI